jgi:2-succinyl-5-enolpyruvyl-6-hydroxy-3-cyclohexene-1-carboxylate synthase
MNEEITYQVLQSCIASGAVEFVVCPGSRNSSFVEILRLDNELTTYYWPEERSAAFFAMGRSKLTGRPVAVITTSGTAAGELLPAAMEAFYSGIPLILITADRPQNYRGSGAPQSAEQVGLYGHYVQFCLDITETDPSHLEKWHKKGPVHLNVCLEEPQKQPKFKGKKFLLKSDPAELQAPDFRDSKEILNHFLEQVKYPLAIVSTLKPEFCEAVAEFLLGLEIPVLLEGISGLREDPRLQSMSMQRVDKILESATSAGYPIDGILRIGGIPTHRIWRDLEYLEGKVKVCALSEQPFSGLSWTRCVVEVPIDRFLKSYKLTKHFGLEKAGRWLNREREFQDKLCALFEDEPEAEPSLIYALSKIIPDDAHIYLGNSLPIREWDMAASRENKNWVVDANRGVNGIDGQISTFLGLCRRQVDNWGFFGDLTTLYDMAAFWILPQLKEISLKIVVINNGGGKIFERMFPYKQMLNEHKLSFRPLAEMWGLDYLCLNNIQGFSGEIAKQFIEIIPNEAATARFWSEYAKIDERHEALILASKG